MSQTHVALMEQCNEIFMLVKGKAHSEKPIGLVEINKRSQTYRPIQRIGPN